VSHRRHKFGNVNDKMETLKGAKRGTHINSLERHYICCTVKENKYMQLHLAMHLQQ
jgi:hypothetical protein